jgi:hypothetical protein
MAPRHKPPCKNCPKKPLPPSQQPADKQAVLRTPQSEGERLWKWILFGTATCVTGIEDFAREGMPGLDASQLMVLRDRLTEVLNTHKVK